MKTYSFNLKNSCFMSLVQLLFEIALHKRVMKIMHAATSGGHSDTNTIKPMNEATLSHAIPMGNTVCNQATYFDKLAHVV